MPTSTLLHSATSASPTLHTKATAHEAILSWFGHRSHKPELALRVKPEWGEAKHYENEVDKVILGLVKDTGDGSVRLKAVNRHEVVVARRKEVHRSATSGFLKAVERAVDRQCGGKRVERDYHACVELNEGRWWPDGSLRAKNEDRLPLVVEVSDLSNIDAAAARVHEAVKTNKAALGVVLTIATRHTPVLDPSNPVVALPIVHLTISALHKTAKGEMALCCDPYDLTITAPPDHKCLDESHPHRHFVSKGSVAKGDDGLLPNLELPVEPFKAVANRVRGERLLVEGKAMRWLAAVGVYDQVVKEMERGSEGVGGRLA